jgi:hypothetical protein
MSARVCPWRGWWGSRCGAAYVCIPRCSSPEVRSAPDDPRASGGGDASLSPLAGSAGGCSSAAGGSRCSPQPERNEGRLGGGASRAASLIPLSPTPLPQGERGEERPRCKLFASHPTATHADAQKQNEEPSHLVGSAGECSSATAGSRNSPQPERSEGCLGGGDICTPSAGRASFYVVTTTQATDRGVTAPADLPASAASPTLAARAWQTASRPPRFRRLCKESPCS